ncbi:MAG TPA: hypothetical protein VFX17_00615 [Patescibacteria group bacterium]|nr:hypothetical protein [Patescibacteria group bacterium]
MKHTLKILIPAVFVCLFFAHTANAQVNFRIHSFGMILQPNDAPGQYTFLIKQKINGEYVDLINKPLDVHLTDLVSLFASLDNEDYLITMDLPPGAVLDSVDCTDSNSLSTFIPIPGGVHALPQGTGNLLCTFTTSKAATSKTPVLIVPGVLGTNIKKGDDVLWLNPLKSIVDPADHFMNSLSFSTDLNPVDPDVTFGSVIGKVGVGRISYDYTQSLRQELIDQHYTEGVDLFTFPYDWRYGVSGKDSSGDFVNLKAFEGQMNYILTQTGAGRSAGKVDVIAHSTGGLIVK